MVLRLILAHSGPEPLLTVVLVEADLLTREPLISQLLIEAPQLGGPVGVLLVPLGVAEHAVILSAERLARNQGRKHTLLRIGSHLPHYVVIVDLLVCYLR